MKVVVNRCYGGFSLSKKALTMLGAQRDTYLCDWAEKKYPNTDNRYAYRADPELVSVVEELGEEADGDCAQLSVVNVPDDIEWTIEEYDGREWVWVHDAERDGHRVSIWRLEVGLNV